jgi:hypothetical protein
MLNLHTSVVKKFTYRLQIPEEVQDRLAKLTPTAERLTGHKTGFRKESDDNPVRLIDVLHDVRV